MKKEIVETKQNTYSVVLKFDGIIADSPLSAAKQVAGDIKENGPDAWIYDVTDESNKDAFTVDLSEDSEDAVLPNK
jgi:hypothetical protein